MQPGRAAPFFFLLLAEFQPDDLHAHPIVAHAREEAEKAEDRRILEVVVAEHIAPARDPQRGAIRVGGHDLREFTCDSLLCNISMVFQNVYLFHDTIRANILFGEPDATEEEMIEAAKKARCHDFIMALPDGYDTVVGEGGGTLSGGEKQRISIARSLLKNAQVLLVDEATAALDAQTAHQVSHAILDLSGMTRIVVTHTLEESALRRYDAILALRDGRIAEQGSFEALMERRGYFYSLYTVSQ